MNILKFQHPQDLISRLFILEYMREIKAPILYEKANKHQKKSLFYKFIDDDNKETVDINWEFCIFGATLHQLESFMEMFLEEINGVEAAREVLYKDLKQAAAKQILETPMDINVMDLAQTEVNKIKEDELKLK